MRESSLLRLFFEVAIAMQCSDTSGFLVWPPVTLRPYRNFDNSVISVDDAAGIYYPNALDDSGRPEFQQVYSFTPYVLQANMPSLSGALSYNKFAGEWCIAHSGSASDACSSATDVVHPLDLGAESFGELQELHVMQITDFASVFEGLGAGATTTQRPSPAEPLPQSEPKTFPPPPPPPPTPPTLDTLDHVDPNYATICKDEYTPGVLNPNGRKPGQKFNASAPRWDKAKMHSIAKNLNIQHPCYYIWSDVKDSQTADADGMSWWNRFDGKEASPPTNDVTYKSVKECADRESQASARQLGKRLVMVSGNGSGVCAL